MHILSEARMEQNEVLRNKCVLQRILLQQKTLQNALAPLRCARASETMYVGVHALSSLHFSS